MPGIPLEHEASIEGEYHGRIEALREQVARLAALVERQQEQAERQQSEIEAQRTQLEAQRARIGDLRTGRAAQARRQRRLRAMTRSERRAASSATVEGERGERPEQVPGQVSSRRALLKWGGAAAAAASLALLASERQGAQAHGLIDGGNLVIGHTNTGTGQTSLAITGASTASPFFQVDASASTFTSGGVGPVALAGIADVPATNTSNISAAGVYGSSSAGFGVYGISGSGPGVYGTSTDDFGLEGQSTNSFGVYGSSSNADAIHGEATSGAGVYGFSEVGISLYAAGGVGTGGRIFSLPYSSSGAPSSGTFSAGEQIRDSAGELWLCVAAGSPGQWVRAAHAVYGYTGGATSYLSKPIRLLDTRPSDSNAWQNPGSPYAGGSTHSLQIAGVNWQSVTVPSAAVGAIGKLTVISYASGGGFVAIVPSGVTPTTGTLPYGANQTVATSFNVGLGGSPGSIDIYVGGTSVDVVIDLFAVVA